MNILITAPFDPEYVQRLNQDHRVFYESWEDTMIFGKGEALIHRLNQDRIEIFITEVDQVDEAVLVACPDLKLICDCRGTPSNIDLVAATQQKVMVTYTPGRNAIAVAELCLGLILSLLRYIPTGHQVVCEGDWDWKVYFTLQGTELSGKTLGLVGFGAVSQALAKLLQGFDLRILAYDPYVSQELADQFHTQLVDLDLLMSESDIVSIHLPVTDETRGLVSAEKLARMKPSAFLINTGRTATVDEGAMLQLLRDKKIAGGAFDVFGKEPLPPGHAYAQLDRVVLTPHIAGATKEIATHQAILILEDIQFFLRGETPPRLCNPDVLI
jgi:D-3-phosphoglycerate dehydrogenase